MASHSQVRDLSDTNKDEMDSAECNNALSVTIQEVCILYAGLAHILEGMRNDDEISHMMHDAIVRRGVLFGKKHSLSVVTTTDMHDVVCRKAFSALQTMGEIPPEFVLWREKALHHGMDANKV